MNFLDMLDKYNQRVSFNIFALNGYIVFFIFIYWNFLVEPDYSYVAFCLFLMLLLFQYFLLHLLFIALKLLHNTNYHLVF